MSNPDPSKDYVDYECDHEKDICECGHDLSLHNNAGHCHGENCTCKAYESESEDCNALTKPN